MKVEQKFIVTIKDNPFELSKEEAESLYYELQKELGLTPKINPIPVWPVKRDVQPYTVPVKDYEWPKTAPYIPEYTITCRSSDKKLEAQPSAFSQSIGIGYPNIGIGYSSICFNNEPLDTIP